MSNVHWAADAATAKAGAGLGFLGWLLTWDASIQLVGVPLNVLLAGLTGSLLGVAWGDPIPSRGKLFATAILNAFLAAAVTAILPHAPLMGWMSAAPQASVAIVLGIACRWVVPGLVEAIPDFIARWRGSSRGGEP